MVKIAFFEIEKWEEVYLRSQLPRDKILFSKGKLTKRNLTNIKDRKILCVSVQSHLTKEILELLPNLRMIATMSTGLDHIDLKACKHLGIKVFNVKDYGAIPVAEHTFALLLALTKKLPQSFSRTKNDDFRLQGLMGIDLQGKILGVIGPGAIGQHVIQIAKAFGMKIIVYGHTKKPELAKRLEFRYVSFSTLLQQSDVISLHVPLTPQTHHLINKKNIKMIKKGAYIINTARGGLIETKALLWALDKGILAGAGLDVLEGECFIKEEKQLLCKDFRKTSNSEILLQNHFILKEKNVIVTPHSAFYTKEALHTILDRTVKNIKIYLKKKR